MYTRQRKRLEDRELELFGEKLHDHTETLDLYGHDSETTYRMWFTKLRREPTDFVDPRHSELRSESCSTLPQSKPLHSINQNGGQVFLQRGMNRGPLMEL